MYAMQISTSDSGSYLYCTFHTRNFTPRRMPNVNIYMRVKSSRLYRDLFHIRHNNACLYILCINIITSLLTNFGKNLK